MNNIRISHGPLVIASDLLDISNPHEYADMLLNIETNDLI